MKREEAEKIFDFSKFEFVDNGTAKKGVVAERIRTAVQISSLPKCWSACAPCFEGVPYVKQPSASHVKKSKLDAYRRLYCAYAGCPVTGYVGFNYADYDASQPQMIMVVFLKGACKHYLKEEQWGGILQLRAESRASTIADLTVAVGTGSMARGSGPTALYNESLRKAHDKCEMAPASSVHVIRKAAREVTNLKSDSGLSIQSINKLVNTRHG